MRLKEHYGKWIHPKDKNIPEINIMIIMEQYLKMVSHELQVWIQEHDPGTAMEAAKLAETTEQCHQKPETGGGKPTTWKNQSTSKP